MASNYIEEYSIKIGLEAFDFNNLQNTLNRVNDTIRNNQRAVSRARDMDRRREGKHERESEKNKENRRKRERAENRRSREQERREQEDLLRRQLMDRLKALKRQRKEERRMQDAASAERLRDTRRQLAEQQRLEREAAAERNRSEQRLTRLRSRRARNQLNRLQEERKAVERLTRALEDQARSIRRSAAYQNLRSRGRSEEFDRRLSMLQVTSDPATMRSNLAAMRDLRASITRTSSGINRLERNMIGLRTVQNGLSDSTRNMIRSYASLFALFEGTAAIKNIGMQFEGMRAAMLAATADNEDVMDNLKFVDALAVRLGVNLKDASDSFIKLKFAAKDKMSTGEIEALFTAVTEFGTALKVNKESMKGGLKAIAQMLNKNQLMAEEVKSQFSEHMPGGLSIFSKALNVTEKDFLKMMERGELVATEVLPKVTVELHKAARANGALDAALKSVSVTEGQFITQSQKAGDLIFKSGFGEGLSELYQTLTDILKDSGPQLKKLGDIFGKMFKGIAHLAKVLEPAFKFIIDNIEMITGAYVLKRIAMLGAAFKTAFLPITAALFAAEELASLMSDKLVGATEASVGRQINILSLDTSALDKRDGEFFKGVDHVERVLGREVGVIETMTRFLENTVVRPTFGMEPVDFSKIPTSRINNNSNNNPTVIENININAPSEEVGYALYNRIISGAEVR